MTASVPAAGDASRKRHDAHLVEVTDDGTRVGHFPRCEFRTFRNARGVVAEWHLLLDNPSEHIEFGLFSRFAEVAVVFGSAFPKPWFKPVRSIGHSMCCDGVKQTFVEVPAEIDAVLAEDGDHRLERFQSLDGALGAD